MRQCTSFALHESPQHRHYQQSARQFKHGNRLILRSILRLRGQFSALARGQLKTVSASRYFQEVPFRMRGVVRPM